MTPASASPSLRTPRSPRDLPEQRGDRSVRQLATRRMASRPPAENESLRRARLAGVQHKITRMGTADDGIVKMLPEHILVVPENAHAIATKINHKLQGSCRQCALALVLHDV